MEGGGGCGWFGCGSWGSAGAGAAAGGWYQHHQQHSDQQ